MQFTNILHLGALLAALQVSAAPAAEPEALISNHANELVRRANPAPNSCGRKLNLEADRAYPREHHTDEFIAASTDQRAWPLESVQDAYNALVSNDRLPNNQKRKTYVYCHSNTITHIQGWRLIYLVQRQQELDTTPSSMVPIQGFLPIRTWSPLSTEFPNA